MRYLVAVSGGVDSVVLLDRLVATGEHELIVAHFDHGIRQDSTDDARFVAALAARYSLPFVSTREELGPAASEQLARKRRYAFLRTTAEKHQAVIVTAHHADDVIETIAINLQRGTGWRGAAVLDAQGVTRPLLGEAKEAIYAYALGKRLEWVEDSTNATDIYLRNRIRARMHTQLPTENKQAVTAIWRRQLKLKRVIDQELQAHIAKYENSRYYFTQIDEKAAAELLRAIIIDRGGLGPTRPQLERALIAIKTARPGTTFEIGAGVKLLFSVRSFIVETP